MEKYKCEKCGKNHAVFRGIKSPLPSLLTDIPEEEQGSRVDELNGFYIIDGKWFLGSGYILIEMEDLDEPIFYWKVWVTMSPKDFQDNFENLIGGKTVELRGRLQSELPFYEKSKGLKSKITIHQSNTELEIEIKIEEESKLKEDQSKPISKNRVIEIMQWIYHHPEREKRQNLDKPFKKRFSQEINDVAKTYLEKEKDFAVNVSTSTTLFQIVSNKILEINRIEERGFGLHLSFDHSFEECVEEITKFRSQEYSKDFDYHNLDGIPTYQIDLGTDKKQLKELVEKIIVDVYEEDLERVEMDNFEV